MRPPKSGGTAVRRASDDDDGRLLDMALEGSAGRVLATQWALRGRGLWLGLGEMAQLLLDSQRVLPRAGLRASYSFQYKTLDAALAHIFAPSGE